MWKRAGIWLFAALFMIVLSGCTKKTLKIGYDREFPPYSYEDGDGNCIGFDIEVAGKVCAMEGWEPEFIPVEWDSKETVLNSGVIDCIWSGFTITNREDAYTVSIPYCNNIHNVVVRSDSNIQSISELKGKVVGVQAAVSASEYLQNDPKGQRLASAFGLLSQFSDFNVAFQSLEDNTLDAVVADHAISKHYVARSQGKLRMIEEDFLVEQYGVAFKKGNTLLREAINDDLRKLAENGTLASLGEKYGIADLICVE